LLAQAVSFDASRRPTQRPARALNALLGVGLIFLPLLFDADTLQFAVALDLGPGLGLVLVLDSRQHTAGAWER